MFKHFISLLNGSFGDSPTKTPQTETEVTALQVLLERMDNLEKRIERNETEIKKMQNNISNSKIEQLQFVRKNGFKSPSFGRRIQADESEVATIENELFWQKSEAAEIRMEIERLDPRILRGRL